MAITVEKVVKEEQKRNKNNKYRNAITETIPKESVGKMNRKKLIKKVAIFSAIGIGVWFIAKRFLKSKPSISTGATNDIPNFN